MTTRRQVLAAGAGVLWMSAAPARAQPRKYRLGFITAQSADAIQHLHRRLFSGLNQLGFTEGQNLIVDRRYAEGRFERLPALAAELVALKPDVIFSSASQATLAVTRATSTVPIVFVAVSDPVGLGIVKSLARPGTNATGLSAQNIEVHSKRLQLLREVFPAAKRVAVLHNPLNLVEGQMLAVLREASRSLHIELRVVDVRTEPELDAAFKGLDGQRPDVLYVLESPFTVLHRARIVALVDARRLPAVYGLHDFVYDGGLMSYSFPLLEHYTIGAQLVARILNGAKPAEIPVEQPTRFELIVNLKTAKAHGVSFPPAILARTDQVVQ